MDLQCAGMPKALEGQVAYPGLVCHGNMRAAEIGFPWDCTETNFGIQLTVLKEKINTFFLRKNQLKILLSFVHPSVGERVL